MPPRGIRVIFGVAVCLLGCAGPVPSSAPMASMEATNGATTPSIPSPERSGPSAPPTPGPAPTLTPLRAVGQGQGAWTPVPGSELVPPNVLAAPAGSNGVLLLAGVSSAACEPPERKGRGTPAAFYDAQSHTITSVTAVADQHSFAMATLGDGRVLIAGGYGTQDSAPEPTSRTQIWDARTRAWTEGARMNLGRSNAALVTMSDGRVIALGGWTSSQGEDCPDCEMPTETAEIYDPATNRWTLTAPIDLRAADGEPEEFDQVVALAGGQLLALAAYGPAALYDPGSDTWTPADAGGGLVSMALPDGTALRFGIEYPGGESDIEVPYAARFDSSSGTRTVGHLRPEWGAATAVLADGRVLMAGGVVEDTTGFLNVYLDTAEVFDPDTGVRTAIAAMPVARGMSIAVPLPDGSVLMIGGVDVAESPPGSDAARCVPMEHRAVRWMP